MVTTTLLLDGMLSGTGIRNAIEGGYIEPGSLGISEDLTKALAKWVSNYWQAHYNGYNDSNAIKILDDEGMALTKRLAEETPDHVVGYYSDARMQRLDDLPHV